MESLEITGNNKMIITPLKLSGTFEIALEPRMDSRGFFMRTYAEEIFEKYGLNKKWVHENHSRSEKLGIIRGLHFQFPPYTETKLVRAVRGKILDVFVDLRKDSPTFGQWDSLELSEENKKMVYIPRGFAHGFCALTEVTEVLYKVDNYYSSEHESGIAWNDSDLNINWPAAEEPFLSERDSNRYSFKEFCAKYKYLYSEEAI